MTTMAPNLRMPRMYLHWAEHGNRVSWLSPFERGVFDMARTVLWQVEGCTMPLETLRKRLGAAGAPDISVALEALTDPAAGLLSVDEGGRVCDPVQVHEFAASVKKAEANRINGRKGGRPSKDEDTTVRHGGRNTPGAVDPASDF